MCFVRKGATSLLTDSAVVVGSPAASVGFSRSSLLSCEACILRFTVTPPDFCSLGSHDEKVVVTGDGTVSSEAPPLPTLLVACFG